MNRLVAVMFLCACESASGAPDGSFEAGEPYCPQPMCPGDQPAVFEIACPGDGVGVSLSGSCDASTTVGATVSVTSGSPGTCNVEITFDGGTFSTAVMFALETPTPLPDCPPGCPPITRPDQPWAIVGSACPSDAGTDADADE